MKLSLNLFLLLIFSLSVQVKAQDPWSEEGEIEDAEVIIEKEREIELPRANRNFERVPPLPVQKPQIDVSYHFVELSPELSDLTPGIRVLKVKEPLLPKLYGNYIKAGAANYLTPYLALFLNNTRSKDYSYGVHLKHLSSRQGPVDGANSGNSDTWMMLNAKYFAKKHTFSAEGGYERERYHYYGYTPGLEIDRDSIRQIFNIAHIQARLQKSVPDAIFDYSMGVSFDRIGDRFGAVENQLGLGLDANIAISDQLNFRIESNSYLMNWSSMHDETMVDSSAISRNLFKFKPHFVYSTGEERGLEARAGFNIAYENDTIQGASRLHFYPYLWAGYSLTEGLSIYGQVEGDMQKTSWLDFTRENPYLASSVGLAHTNKTLGFLGGIKGRISSVLGFNAGIDASNFKNMYFFVNNAEDSTKFDVLYDTGNTFLINLFGELQLSSGNRFRSSVRGDYYYYSTAKISNPWHKPNFKLSLLADYNLYEKILLSTELMVLTGIEGYNAASNTSKMLDPIADLSFKADYIFSSRFSSFLQLKNIFAQNYERYLNYPSRGIMVMLGATYSF